MKTIRMLFTMLMLFSLPLSANDNPELQFSNYPIKVISGPFSSVLKLTSNQQKSSEKWKGVLSDELKKTVNFAGHYRLYISDKGEFPSECGAKGWVCGWVIDKMTGRIVSELPDFNGNTAYFSIIDNGTPSPDPFYIEYYPNRTLIFVGGENTPKEKHGDLSPEDRKCAYSKYKFTNGEFYKISSVGCENDSD